jgi:hypothetical protein
MNFKTTILLLIVLAGIGAYVIFTHHSAEPTDQTTQPPVNQGTKLTDLTADDLSKIAIKPTSGGEIILQKAGSDWRLVEPIAAPADAGTVSTLIGALVDLRSAGQLTADQKSAAGLDQPPYTVELTDKSGKVTTIAFGSKPAFGDALDVIVNNRDKPDVVSASIYTQLEQPASAYRKTNLVSVMSDQIKQISITQPGEPTIGLQKTANQWKLSTEGPTTNPALRVASPVNADSSATGDITTALSGLSAKTFVDEQQPHSYFGLAHPSMTVWFTTAAPQTQPGSSAATQGTTILFGRPVDVSKADVYASVDGQIVTIPSVVADTFKKSTLDLRDKTVLDIDPSTVTSVNVVADRTPETKALGPNIAPRWNMTYERKEESHVAGPPIPTTGPTTAPAKATSHWSVVSGMRVADADDAKVDALLQIFHPLTVQKYIESAATTQSASTYDITLKAGPTRTEKIKITDPGGANPLIGSYGDAIFELDRALLPKINGDATSK